MSSLKISSKSFIIKKTKQSTSIGKGFAPSYFEAPPRKPLNFGKTPLMLRRQLRAQKELVRKINLQVKAIERINKGDAVSQVARHRLLLEVARYAELEWKLAEIALNRVRRLAAKKPGTTNAEHKREIRFTKLALIAQEKQAIYDNFTKEADTIWERLKRKNFKD